MYATGGNIVLDIDYYNIEHQVYMLGWDFKIVPDVHIYPLVGIKRKPQDNNFNIGMGCRWKVYNNLYLHGKLSLEGLSAGIGVKLW